MTYWPRGWLPALPSLALHPWRICRHQPSHPDTRPFLAPDCPAESLLPHDFTLWSSPPEAAYWLKDKAQNCLCAWCQASASAAFPPSCPLSMWMHIFIFNYCQPCNPSYHKHLHAERSIWLCAVYGRKRNVKHMDNKDKVCSTEPKFVTLVPKDYAGRANISSLHLQ